MKGAERRVLLIVVALAALSLWSLQGCDDGGDADGDSDADGDTDVDGDTDADGDGDCALDSCHAAPYDLNTVTGRALDAQGQPWAGRLSAIFCPANADRSNCLFQDVDATGSFTVTVPPTFGQVESVAVSFTSSELLPIAPFCHYEQLCDGDIELCQTFRLRVAPSSGTTLTLNGALGAEVRIEASDTGALVLPATAEALPPIGYDWLALTRYPLDEDVPCFVEASDLPVALYVVTPIDTMIIEPGTMVDPVLVPAAIDVPNEAGLAAGATLDVYVLGGVHGLQVGTHEGEWRAWSTATVSADGSRIQTATGEGIGYLTWFALYPR